MAIADNPFKKWCEDLHIKQVLASVAHPQTNGQVETIYRSIVEGIKVCLGKQGSAWVDELLHVLWAYRTTQKSGKRESPFSLTYGTEAVIPAEIVMPSRRIQEYDTNDEELRINLYLVKEQREMATIRELNYKREMEKYYNKRVKEIKFRDEEYVMRNNEACRMEP
ncbi:uncharacterized protein LOC143589146 [Bidens hawaiensis]|uniref:uncharacterized protein LOC143589146 n=1 Tax=Bidens hawaiensis TaxID=980011 RepID=UPI00404972BD